MKSIYRLYPLVGVIALFAWALSSGFQRFSPARFDEERIEIWAFSGQVQVTGYYHYVNPSYLPASFSLSLPFPVDSMHPRPSSFSIRQVDRAGNSEKEIAVRIYHGDVVFRLGLLPKRDKWIRVDYVQGAGIDEARYILLTTRQWRRPLHRGQYILHLGAGLQLVSSNYPLAEEPSGDLKRYTFSATDFLPSQDWEFQWASTGKLEESEFRHDPHRAAATLASDSFGLCNSSLCQ